MRRLQRLAGLTVAGLTVLVAVSALVLEALGAGGGWVVACLALVSAFVTFTAVWFERASRGGRAHDPGRLIILPVIWVLLLVFVVLPVSGGA